MVKKLDNNPQTIKFRLTVTIQSISGAPNRRKMVMTAIYSASNSPYGNGLYLLIRGEENCTIDEAIDLRYEPIDTNMLDLNLATWAYNYWSGLNGSWDIHKLTIERI